jgi:DNA-binding response OmpR family regulator
LESVLQVANKRIFIVDDEEDLNRLMKLSLESAGDFDVDYVSQPQNALGSAREFGPDLMILDLVMPGMDGGELVMKIKEDEVLRNVPVIFLTASISTGLRDDGSTLFGYPCLKKPVAMDELLDLIEEKI